MQTVDICNPDIVEFYCPRCGQKNLRAGEEVQPCEHLLYAGSSETDAWYESEEAGPFEMEEEDLNSVGMLERNLAGSEHILFLLSAPAPAGLEMYLVYRLAG